MVNESSGSKGLRVVGCGLWVVVVTGLREEAWSCYGLWVKSIVDEAGRSKS